VSDLLLLILPLNHTFCGFPPFRLSASPHSPRPSAAQPGADVSGKRFPVSDEFVALRAQQIWGGLIFVFSSNGFRGEKGRAAGRAFPSEGHKTGRGKRGGGGRRRRGRLDPAFGDCDPMRQREGNFMSRNPNNERASSSNFATTIIISNFPGPARGRVAASASHAERACAPIFARALPSAAAVGRRRRDCTSRSRRGGQKSSGAAQSGSSGEISVRNELNPESASKSSGATGQFREWPKCAENREKSWTLPGSAIPTFVPLERKIGILDGGAKGSFSFATSGWCARGESKGPPIGDIYRRKLFPGEATTEARETRGTKWGQVINP